MVIDKAKRATPQIVEQILHLAQTKQGVMIFAATVRHAQRYRHWRHTDSRTR